MARHAMIHRLTNSWFLSQTSLAMTPEHCAVSCNNWLLTSARAAFNHVQECSLAKLQQLAVFFQLADGADGVQIARHPCGSPIEC